MSGILATHLIDEGFAVVTVVDGAKAFERIQAEQPDIVLLDIIPPGVGGFDILEKLKKEESTKAIPVLILSNLGSTEEMKRGIDLGAVGYLIKANTVVEEIVTNIKNVLARHSSH